MPAVQASTLAEASEFLPSFCSILPWRGAPCSGAYVLPTKEGRRRENNGRMAMISVLGIFAAEMATGKDAMQQFGLSAIGNGKAAPSPASFAGKTTAVAQRTVMRRAFQPSQQIGASEPLGFFDPLSFTSEGDEQGFKKLRAAEIKHGRVSVA